MTMRETYKVEIEGVTRELPLFAVGPEVRIAVFNLLGDTEIIGVAAEGLASRLAGFDFDVLVTAEMGRSRAVGARCSARSPARLH